MSQQPPESLLVHVPKIHLLCIADEYIEAFKDAASAYNLPAIVSVSFHDCSLSALPESVKFDAAVSPANSYGIMDGGFDDALSRAFSPQGDYIALTRAVQARLYEDWRGFAPPGTCAIVPIPDEFAARSKNVWGTRFIALCPTMRVPMNVTWDREVVYEAVWSLLCSVDKHNRATNQQHGKINSLLMTPMATGTGRVSAEKWATQTVLAIKHFVAAVESPEQWGAVNWRDLADSTSEVQLTWNK